MFALATAVDVDLQHPNEHGPGGFPGILLRGGLLHDHGGFLGFRLRFWPARGVLEASGTSDHEIGAARSGGGPAGLLLGGGPWSEFLELRRHPFQRRGVVGTGLGSRPLQPVVGAGDQRSEGCGERRQGRRAEGSAQRGAPQQQLPLGPASLAVGGQELRQLRDHGFTRAECGLRGREEDRCRVGVALPGECGLLRVDGTVGTQGGHRGGQPVVVDVRSLRRNTAVEQHLEVLEGVASRLGVLWEGRQLFADSVEFHESDEGVGERVEPGLQRALHGAQLGTQFRGVALLAYPAGGQGLCLGFQLLAQQPVASVLAGPEPLAVVHHPTMMPAGGGSLPSPGNLIHRDGGPAIKCGS